MRLILSCLSAMILACTAIEGHAQTAEIEFDGRIEALRKAEVSAAVETLVLAVHFQPGERVERGQKLFTLDDADLRIALETARANVLRAELTLVSAREDLQRTQELSDRGATTSVALFKAEAAHTLADAVLARTRADYDAAQLKLGRTIVTAPIDGVVGEPEVAPGAYVKPGRMLAHIVQLDPVRVTYQVPYVERITQLELEALTFPESLLERVELSIRVPDGWEHPHVGYPRQVSSDIDPETGTLTVWAEVANDNALLRPGMAVKVSPMHLPAEGD